MYVSDLAVQLSRMEQISPTVHIKIKPPPQNKHCDLIGVGSLWFSQEMGDLSLKLWLFDWGKWWHTNFARIIFPETQVAGKFAIHSLTLARRTPTKTCLVLSYDYPVVFSEGAVPVARVGYQSSQHFPTFPVGCRSYESSFPKTWWTMAMVTEGEGPQPWAMGISCAPTGTRRRLACEKWWEDGDKRCVLEGCSCAWADSCWFWTLFLKILACHFCNLREGDELGLRPEMSIGWAAQTAGRHVLTPPLIWKHKTIRMPLGQTCEPERRQQKLMEKCNQMHHALVIPNMDPNHTYWCLADRLIRLGFSIALRPTLSVCAWCQGANTKAWVDSVALSQPKSL